MVGKKGWILFYRRVGRRLWWEEGEVIEGLETVVGRERGNRMVGGWGGKREG
jgi:hypothetical protein